MTGGDANSPVAGPDREDGRRVEILLALYQGEAFLREQLDSFAAQGHANWSILVSDDASTDDGPATVAAFAADHPGRAIRMTDGPRRGYGQNFLHLLTCAGDDAAAFALSDQDDVWLPHHLDSALSALDALPDHVPGLYCARSTVCGQDLTPRRDSTLFPHPPAFANALVQSLAGGHSMVLNRAALDLARRGAPAVEGEICHDWWLYQLVTGAGGTVIYDRRPALLYRQHGGNEVGDSVGALDVLGRIGKLLGGRFRRWNRINTATLSRLRPLLTDDALRRLDLFIAAQESRWPPRRVALLRRSGVWRQTRPGQIAMYFIAMLGRM